MKKIYERPLTTFIAVETETGFMGGSVWLEEEDTEDLKINNQEVGEVFDFTSGDDTSWD